MKKQHVLITMIALIFLIACGEPVNTPAETVDRPINIIFETDMGNDVDDALALDMLYKYVEQGRINLLGISTNKNSDYSIPFLRIMNNWYGHPGIPLGAVMNGANSQGDSKDYAQATYDYQQGLFRKYITDSSKAINSVELYRQLLAKAADTSVTIVSVGFSTNIARLLDTKPDNYSPLGGKDLVKKKVKLLSMMAGNFNGKLKAGEYNVIKDTLAAAKVFAEWPTPIVASPFEVGISILYPATSIQNDLNWTPAHPLKVAYESYQKMPYDRPTWDLTSVLYVVENDSAYFSISQPGRISVGSQGRTQFTNDSAGQHRYVSVDSLQAQRIRNRFIGLIKMKPQRYAQAN